MAIFKRKRESADAAVCASPQTRQPGPLCSLPRYASPADGSRLLDELRRSLPILDGAINKIALLAGGFTVSAPGAADREIKKFLDEVTVSGSGKGLESFFQIYLTQLLTYGTAVGEIILSPGGTLSLYNARLQDIVLIDDKTGNRALVCRSGVNPVPFKNQNSILLSVLNPEPGKLTGRGILSGTEERCAILLGIYRTIGANWERFGNLRYAVTYKPQNDSLDLAYAAQRAKQIAEEWSEAMQAGTVRDFIAVGDVDISVIGADVTLPDSESAVRQLLEQIIAKTGLPPFALGLSWSTTERMALEQTEIFVSQLWGYRKLLEPVILKICSLYLRLRGFSGSCAVEWEEITLRDELDEAKSLYYRSLASANRDITENEVI